MSKTRIVIIQLKEIVYTAIFVGLGILLIILLVFMFMPDKKGGSDTAEAIYTPGVYTTQLSLGDTEVNLEVVVDADHINSVSLVNIDDSVTTMYPLVKPAVDTISEQLSAGTPLDSVEISEESQYTQTLLLDAIDAALAKARGETD